MENIEDLLDVSRQEQQKFFESKSPEWESMLDLVEIDHVGLSDLLNEYVSNPQDYAIGSILQEAGSQITRARSIDLNEGHGLAITQDEREELSEILKQRYEEGELEYDANHVATFAFQHEGRSFVATFSGPIWQGGYEWDLLSMEEHK